MEQTTSTGTGSDPSFKRLLNAFNAADRSRSGYAEKDAVSVRVATQVSGDVTVC